MSKQKGTTKVAADKKRLAKPVGFRKKGNHYENLTDSQVKKGLKDGTVYKETRANRSDKKPNVKVGIGRNLSFKTGGLLI